MIRPARHSLPVLAPLVIYAALSLVFFTRAANWRGFYFGSSPDPVSFIWFLNWWPFALSHGLNPFISTYVWHPGGYNFAWATSIPCLALLAWPITALGGPVLSFNILTLAAPALAGWTAFLLARELTADWPASLLAGFLFGFSAPEYWELISELNLDFTCFIPLALWLCLRRLRGRIGRGPFILALSLVLLAQLGISSEFLAALCFLGAVNWALFLAFTPRAGRPAFWRLAADIALCAPLTLALAVPFLYFLVKGLPDVPAEFFPAVIASADAARLLIPALPFHGAAAALRAIAEQVKGFRPDNGTVLGLPLLLILMAYFWRHRAQAYGRALLLSLLLTILLSLGPRLHFNGRITSLWLPWSLIEHVPLLRAILPGRLTIFVALQAALIAALWLAAARRRPQRLARYALAGLACLVLLPASVQLRRAPWQIASSFPDAHSFVWTRWPAPPFFTPAQIRATLGAGANALLLPSPVNGPGMAWQLDAGMSFYQATGYVGFRPLAERPWKPLRDFLVLGEGLDQRAFQALFTAYCAARHAGYVLIGPGLPAPAVRAIESLGWPYRTVQGIEIVTVPPASGPLTPAAR